MDLGEGNAAQIEIHIKICLSMYMAASDHITACFVANKRLTSIHLLPVEVAASEDFSLIFEQVAASDREASGSK
jgi:hypothetical protein